MSSPQTITIDVPDTNVADLLVRVAKAIGATRVQWQPGLGIDAAEGPTTPPTDPGGPADAKR